MIKSIHPFEQKIIVLFSPFPWKKKKEKKNTRRVNTRTKSPLYMCSSSGVKKALNQRSIKDSLERLWELWKDEKKQKKTGWEQLDGNYDLDVHYGVLPFERIPLQSQASLHTVIIKSHFSKTGHAYCLYGRREDVQLVQHLGFHWHRGKCVQVSELEEDQNHIHLCLLQFQIFGDSFTMIDA